MTEQPDVVTEQNRRPPLINSSDGLGLLVYTVLGFAVLLSYEFGAALALGLPLLLIDVSLGDLVQRAPELILVVALAMIYTAASMKAGTIIVERPLFGRLMLFALIAVTLLPGLYLFRYAYAWTTIGLVIGILAILLFVWPLLSHRKFGTFNERLEAADRSMYARLQSRKSWLLNIQPWSANVFAAACMTLSGMFSTGAIVSRNQEEFLVLPGPPEMVVLRRYGDQFVCARFDRQQRRILQDFRVIDVKSDQFYTRERVGPLKPPNTIRVN
jgi:hypothetical protein